MEANTYIHPHFELLEVKLVNIPSGPWNRFDVPAAIRQWAHCWKIVIERHISTFLKWFVNLNCEVKQEKKKYFFPPDKDKHALRAKTWLSPEDTSYNHKNIFFSSAASSILLSFPLHMVRCIFEAFLRAPHIHTNEMAHSCHCSQVQRSTQTQPNNPLAASGDS